MKVVTSIVSLPSFLLFILITVVGVIASEVGAWFAQSRVIKKGIKEPEASISAAVGAMMGLLAFILGLTFSITSSRFAERKRLVVEQSNAIGTCYLRTSMLPEKQKTEIRRLFKDYTGILIAARNASDIQGELDKLQAIHLQIWDQTASLADEKMDSELRSLFTKSVNDVIDIASERETVTLVYRIPGTLWISLFVLFMLCMLQLGYQMGTFNTRRILSIPLLAGAFAMVMVLIANMDIPSRRNFQVSQKPLEDVHEMMQENIR